MNGCFSFNHSFAPPLKSRLENSKFHDWKTLTATGRRPNFVGEKLNKFGEGGGFNENGFEWNEMAKLGKCDEGRAIPWKREEKRRGGGWETPLNNWSIWLINCFGKVPKDDGFYIYLFILKQIKSLTKIRKNEKQRKGKERGKWGGEKKHSSRRSSASPIQIIVYSLILSN